MGEATFSVQKIMPPECDHLDCFNPSTLEVALIGSPVPHHEVCSAHKQWAKEHLITQAIEREKRRQPREEGQSGE